MGNNESTEQRQVIGEQNKRQMVEQSNMRKQQSNYKIPPQTPMTKINQFSAASPSKYALTDQSLKLRLQSKADNNLSSKKVQSRINSLPLSQVRLTNSAVKYEQESYDNVMKAKFVGEKVNGRPHGFGKLYFDNNDYLEGTFVDGRCEGQGRIIKADGSYYEGEIINNEADGHGKYYDINGYKYQGKWKSNLPNGTGQAIYQDGSRYVGQFLNNKRNGKGMYIINNDIFQGQFKNDKIQGYCIFACKNGERYEGQWRQSLKQGFGKYYWPDGKRYQGQYKNDHRHGFGTMYYSDKQKYVGKWQNGMKHGEGTMETDNNKLTGNWCKGNLLQVKK